MLQTEIVLNTLNPLFAVLIIMPSIWLCQCTSLMSSWPWWTKSSCGGTSTFSSLSRSTARSHYVMFKIWLKIKKFQFYLCHLIIFATGGKYTRILGAPFNWGDRARVMLEVGDGFLLLDFAQIPHFYHAIITTRDDKGLLSVPTEVFELFKKLFKLIMNQPYNINIHFMSTFNRNHTRLVWWRSNIPNSNALISGARCKDTSLGRRPLDIFDRCLVPTVWPLFDCPCGVVNWLKFAFLLFSNKLKANLEQVNISRVVTSQQMTRFDNAPIKCIALIGESLERINRLHLFLYLTNKMTHCMPIRGRLQLFGNIPHVNGAFFTPSGGKNFIVAKVERADAIYASLVPDHCSG